jgi:hypothetical protein
MVVVFFCLISDHVKPFFICEGLRGRTREGAAEPPGERKWGKVCSFERGTEGRKTFLLM